MIIPTRKREKKKLNLDVKSAINACSLSRIKCLLASITLTLKILLVYSKPRLYTHTHMLNSGRILRPPQNIICVNNLDGRKGGYTRPDSKECQLENFMMCVNEGEKQNCWNKLSARNRIIHSNHFPSTRFQFTIKH